jgi:hypothetical protein
MFSKDGPADLIVKITAPERRFNNVLKSGLPREIEVRLIRVILSTGEVEVLVTSLMNKNNFKMENFQELYFLRWGVETFFSKLKGRLNLENFTGFS